LAGSQKEFELLFKLKASLGGSFNSTFKNAINTNNQLRDSLKNVNSLQSKIDGYTKQSAAIDKNKERLAQLNAEHDRLQQELQQTSEPTEALRRKLERNESQIQQTTARIEEQQTALNELAEQLQEAGVNTENLEEANGRLQRSYERLQSSQATLAKINEKQEAVKNSISATKTQLLGTIGAVTAAATSFFALDAATEEYRVNQAKLNTAYQAAGMSANAAQEAYAGFYKILGDNDTATEASQLLAKLTKNEQDIAKWTAIAAGVNGTFGDSLPIEGLIESANETARVGQITGVLADAINWASKEGETFGVTLKENTKANEEWNKAVNDCKSAEDYFNLALQQCGSEAERNKLIMDTLQGSYKDATAAFYENNKQIMQTRQSQIIYNDILADLGRIAGTVKGIILEMLGVTTDGTVKANSVISKVQETVSKLADNPELIKTITKVVAGLAALRVGMLGAKLVGLSTESGLLSLAGKLVGLRAGLIENAATSVGFATKLKAAGSGVLSYFGNVGSALGGVGSAVGNLFSGNAIVGKITGMLGGAKTVLFNGISGIAGKAAGVFTSAGSKMLGHLLKPFTALGGKLGGVLSGLGGVIARSPLGTIGKFIGAGFSKATTLIAPLGNAIKTVLGPIGNLAKTALGPLGGIAGKILPVVGVFTAIVTVIQLVKNHLEEIRSFIQRTFGDEALAIFDKIVAVITNIGDTIKGVFSDGNIGAARDKITELFGDKGAAVFDTFISVIKTVKNAVSDVVGFIITYVVPVAEQVLQVITTQVIPGIVSFIQAAAPTIMTIIQSIADFIGAIIPVIGSFIASLMPIISEIISFISTYVLPIISELFSFICSTVLPAISAAVQAILPVVQNVLQTLLPAIQTALTTIWNIVSPIIQGILAAVQAAMPTIQAVVTAVVNAISGVISGLATVLNGIITFITGVFTGNWRQAWDGIKSIFSGIWEAIKSVAKGAVNGIISIVNGIIGGLNKLKIPDWVPGLGGKGINIPLIPMLAKGSHNTPDTFIAGEEGPELITNAPGRTVFTADQTRNILAAQNAAATTAAAVAPTATTPTAQTVNSQNAAPEVTPGAGSGGGAKNVTINNNPTIVINGDKPEDLDAKLEENNRKLLRDVEDLLDEKEDKERRQKYD